tara:strand:+ start:3426 stop:3620 length:195 start_codon:yes stop_codon:yes gene_type:complete
MKIKALKNTSASGQSLEVGNIYDVSDQDASILIRMGKAEESIEAPACPPTPPKTKKVKASVNSD